MRILIKPQKPISSKKYFEKMAKESKLPFLDRPCHDCAITTGFYTPIADELLEQTEDLQDKVLETWFCHNHCDKSCRGAYNYIHSMRKKLKK